MYVIANPKHRISMTVVIITKMTEKNHSFLAVQSLNPNYYNDNLSQN